MKSPTLLLLACLALAAACRGDHGVAPSAVSGGAAPSEEAATTAPPPSFVSAAEAFAAALVASDTEQVMSAFSFPVTFTTHVTTTNDGRTFSLAGKPRVGQADGTKWRNLETCGDALVGDVIDNIPVWRCAFFYRGGGLAVPELVVDESGHRLATPAYDPSKADQGMAFVFANQGGTWRVTRIEVTEYQP